MSWFQKPITLEGRSRGFHLVTREILDQLPELKNFESGRAHFFLIHTSASLSINENADASVRHDLDKHMAHRGNGGPRSIVVTLSGEASDV